MGMVPIPVLSPLTFSTSDDPVLEPSLPIGRVNLDSADTGDHPDGGSPRQDGSPDDGPVETEIQPTPDSRDTLHQVSFFA